MAHEIENMMFVGATPWHGLGIKLPKAPTIEEAIVAGGLDWSVRLEQLAIASDNRKVEAQATVRESDNSILGVVGPNYHILQNKEAFKFFQPFVDSGQASLETAGSLKQGRKVFILAKTNTKADIVSNDAVENYILLSNSHDGTLSIRVGFTPIRVVCANTLSAAHANKASKLIRIKHTQGSKDALALVQRVMDTANAEFNASILQYRALAAKQCNAQDLEKYVKVVLGVPAHDMKSSDIGNRVMAEIIPLFEKGRGNDMPGVRGTMWAAYNAFNEYLGYVKGRNQDNRLDSLWFGQGAVMNQRALEVATSMVQSA